MGVYLSTTQAADLGAVVIKEALNRAGVAPDQVDHVYMGCVIQAGLGQNIARQATLKAGLPNEVPADEKIIKKSKVPGRIWQFFRPDNMYLRNNVTCTGSKRRYDSMFRHRCKCKISIILMKIR